MQYFVPSDNPPPLRILAEAFPPGTAVPMSVARAAARFVNRLDLLQGHRCAGNVHLAAVAVFVVLAFPDQFGFELGVGGDGGCLGRRG